MNGYASGGIAPRILNLGTRWRWVVSFAMWLIIAGGKAFGTCWTGGCIVSKSDSILRKIKQDRQLTYNVTLPRVRVTIVAVEMQYVLHILSVCVCVVLFIQYEKRMHRITRILASVSCLVVPEFSALPHKRHDRQKEFLNIKCVFWFSLQLLYEAFFILRKIQRGMIINVRRSLYKVPFILVRL
jgi:hypothetical protein